MPRITPATSRRRFGMAAAYAPGLIAAAKARAEREGAPASFIRANAQTYAFEPASFDMIISRFGVMFLDDSIEAFGTCGVLQGTAPNSASSPGAPRRIRHDDGRARRG